MDEVVERIKGYALVIDPGMPDNEVLDQIVMEVVDRVLIYTNRYQLVSGYEKFLKGEYYEGTILLMLMGIGYQFYQSLLN